MILALDPAQPGFETESNEVRLNKQDAEFVDVLHTDAKPFIPFIGFGMLLPIGTEIIFDLENNMFSYYTITAD